MELHEALTQISEIHRRASATGEFRGYRAVPVAISGLAAIIAAIGQPYVVPDPVHQVPRYLLYWSMAAAIAATPAAIRIYLRDWRDAHSYARELTRLAVAQFLPSLAAGALAAVAIARHAPEFSWALPGLWQLFFSLGIFASCRLLPRATAIAGMIYLAFGTWNLAYAQGELALSPWIMGAPFAIGQFVTAAVFFRSQELDRVKERE